MIKLNMEDPGICDNCVFCRENSNTGASECILKPNHYEVDIHSKDENCPIIAVEEGEWICAGDYDDCGRAYCHCSLCHEPNGIDWTHYCPNCGAKMKNADP